MLRFDDRFARQNRCEPPPEFPLASPYPSIVHHLSGPRLNAPTQIHPNTSGSVDDAPKLSPTFTFITRAGFTPKHSRKTLTPWSVFQDGSDGELAGRCGAAPRGARQRRADTVRADDGCRGRLGPPGFGRRRGRQRSTPRADRRTSRSRSAYGRCASPAPIRFPPGNFKHSLTLFSKSFSSFPRGTCSLSVSRLYLALDGVYRPIWAAFPNNPTR